MGGGTREGHRGPAAGREVNLLGKDLRTLGGDLKDCPLLVIGVVFSLDEEGVSQEGVGLLADGEGGQSQVFRRPSHGEDLQRQFLLFPGMVGDIDDPLKLGERRLALEELQQLPRRSLALKGGLGRAEEVLGFAPILGQGDEYLWVTLRLNHRQLIGEGIDQLDTLLHCPLITGLALLDYLHAGAAIDDDGQPPRRSR